VKRICYAATLLLLALLAPAAVLTAQGSPARPETPVVELGGVLLIENTGQFDPAARFQVWGSPLGAGTTWVAENAIWVVVSSNDKEKRWQGNKVTAFDPTVTSSPALPITPPPRTALKLTFPGSNPGVRLEPFDPVETTVSYLIGNDPDQWHPTVPVWGGVRYVDLYPGVNLTINSPSGAWKLDAAPGAAIEQVRMQVEGADIVASDGALLQLDADGEPLFIALPSAAFAYQAAGLSRQGDPLTLVVRSGLHSPQPALPADDPGDLLYGTFLGGSADEVAYGTAVDGSGAAYVTGCSYSSDFPTTPGAFDTSATNQDIFLVKLNPAGSDLDYATFVGGSNHDAGYDIAVDGSGAAYVTGRTSSYDFPTTPGAFDMSFNSGQYDTDAFAIKVSADGTDLAYATYLGGSYNNNGAAIAVDGSGAAYVTGWTGSDYHSGFSDFPITPGAFDTTHNGGGDAFVAKLNAAGSALVYATFLGGNDMDTVCGIAVDESGAAYVTGWTGSSNFPTTPGAFDTTRTGGIYEGFVAKLNAAGSGLEYATFLGGGSDEQGFDIAVDGSGAAYVTGTTGSSDFPTTPGAFDTSFNGPTGAWGDAFVVKLNAAGSALDYGTFLGGSSQDAGQGIAVDGSGAAYVTGWAGSPELPTTCGAFDRRYNGGYDVFVAKLNTAGSALDYATFLGGSSQDMGGGDFDRRGNSIAVNGSGRVYVTGTTASSDFPTTPAAFDMSYNGGDADAFVAKLSMGAPYSICGRVTDTRGQGISGVTVSAGAGDSSITDTSGDYTINNLSSGTYTLTPTLEKRSFDPVMCSADVPPNADGRDFELVPNSVCLPLVLRNH
jgi:hypothetical protein